MTPTAGLVDAPRELPSGAPPGARLLLGGPIAAEIRVGVQRDVASLRRRHGFVPGVTIVLAGKDPASRVYAGRILRNAEALGLPSRLVELPASATATRLRRVLEAQNADPLVGGIIVQMPLPPGIPLRTVIESIDPQKDIDGIHPLNTGLMTLGYTGYFPSCAEAAVEILKRSGYGLSGMSAVVVGRSNVVGKPAHLLLMREDATVTVCHRKTRDLAGALGAADVVVVAAGMPGLIRGEMLKPGAIVVDCGINVVDGQIIGDVHLPSVSQVASVVTPVPGGVGPVTNAVLMEHLVRAARSQLDGGAVATLRGRGRTSVEHVRPAAAS